jgi:hypothetical protein
MLAMALNKGTVHLFSEGLSPVQMAATGAVPCHDLSGDLRRAVQKAEGRRLAVIPEGPYVAAETESESEGGGDEVA